MHAAVGDAEWFANSARSEALADGFAEGCRMAGAVWGGGETPTLRGIVNAESIVLAGSAIGRITPKKQRIIGDVRDGDAIIMVASSGVQTNGLTLCRSLAERLSDGYVSRIDDGRPYGEALLDPSVIYVKLIAGLQRLGLRPHYAIHVTGHGWRKLMRLEEPFVYHVRELRQSPAIFEFILRAGPVDVREAYATFNMGVGFALIVGKQDAAAVVQQAGELGYVAWVGGVVQKDGSRKAVEIEPLKITYESDTLQVR
jgi:phosphoribosylformylglycinamidine cyclo-ligase